VTHPTGPVAAVLLALAERTRLTGDAFLTALVLGIEVACRLSKALLVPPARGQVGWYITGVTGGIGAALAAAKVLGLDRQQTIWALGIAAAQASGFRQTHATMSTSFVPAHAARCGLQAALLAARGFTCSDRILEGPHGFATVFAAEAHLAAATPAVLAVRARIAATPDESVGRDGAIVRLELADGRVPEKRVEHCIGSLARPMTDAELEAKFMGQALQVLPEASARALMALCWRLEALDDVAEVARASY
jgi:2-methylcitrate dehydratase PrpD